jgi:PilZ domain
MANKRKSERIDCYNNCQLMYNGKKYMGILENISTTGALIKYARKHQRVIPDGTRCSLIIGNDSILIPGEFTSKVIHNNQHKMGLQFQFSE